MAGVRRVMDRVTRHVAAAARKIGWRVKAIWRRLTNEPGYAEAVAALAIAAADLFVGGPQLRRLVRQAASTFVIVIRSLMGDGGMPDPYWP